MQDTNSYLNDIFSNCTEIGYCLQKIATEAKGKTASFFIEQALVRTDNIRKLVSEFGIMIQHKEDQIHILKDNMHQLTLDFDDEDLD